METQSREDVQKMMAMLLDHAKTIREGYKYSGDEKMIPTAFIYSESGIDLMMMGWRDNREKKQMAIAANFRARTKQAKSLSFVTDSRWVKSEVFCNYFHLPLPTKETMEDFKKVYHAKLAEYGGEIKKFPREIWEEAVVVFTNGPGIPITIQMAPYKEGPDDSIEWLPRDAKHTESGGQSDLLTDWWS